MQRTLAITDCRIPEECKARLTELGFDVLRLPPHRALESATASHTDMLLFKLRDTIVTAADYYENEKVFFARLKELRPHLRITPANEAQSEKYPHDCILNALYLNERIYCKTDTVSGAIKELARRYGIPLVHVKQGYPACTVLKAKDTAITADVGMARVLSESGVNVTVIQKGGISLPPYEYGFIGGCSGYYDGVVYFYGDPLSHPDGERIVNALKARGLRYEALYRGKLLDLGGILFT